MIHLSCAPEYIIDDLISSPLTDRWDLIKSTSMKHNCLLLLLVLMIAGCETPQPTPPDSQLPSVEGLKLSDLKENSGSREIEPLMIFRVYTYTIALDSVDELSEVVNLLSQTEVRAANKGAFGANGFTIGAGTFHQGTEVAKKLASMGAVRKGQSRLMFPPDKTTVLSQVRLQGTENIRYATSESVTRTLTPAEGFLGWVFSARPDPRFRGMAQVKLFPATWQLGIDKIRMAMGQDAFDYQPIREGQVLLRVEERGLFLLGPSRGASDEMTLDKSLFFIPGPRPKLRFFVIICDTAEI